MFQTKGSANYNSQNLSKLCQACINMLNKDNAYKKLYI